MNNSENNLRIKKEMLFQAKNRIRDISEHRIQQAMNDTVVLTMLRIVQLIDSASSECEALFMYIKQSVVSDDVRKIVNDQVSISKSMIVKRLQVFMDLMCHDMIETGSDNKPIKAIGYDIKRLERLLIKGIIKSHIKPIETNKVFSRFLWIVYSRVVDVDYESLDNRHTYIGFDDFKEMVKYKNVITPKDFRWRGEVIDAALLAKSKVEKELRIENSLDFNHRTVSARTIEYIKNHDAISNNCIVKQLQEAMNKLCVRKTSEDVSQYKMRTREARWFISLFEEIPGEAYLQIPTRDILWGYFENIFDSKIRYKTASIDEIIDEEELQGKRLVCFDNRIVAVGNNSSIPIFVAQGSVSCQRNQHIVINVEAIVKTVKENKEVKLPIQKCISCKPSRYFISDVVLDEYEKKYGIMYFRRAKYYDNDNPKDMDKEEWINPKTESILLRMGYNVNVKTGLSDFERQRILVRIISSGEITKTQAMRHIEGLIRRNERSSNFIYAIPKWKRDLYYLANLKDVDLLYYGRLYR